MIDIPEHYYTAPHALFAPSSAYRWIDCPASIGRSIGVKPLETTWQAEEGSAAHWVLERCLNAGNKAITYLDATAPNGWKISEEICQGVQWAIDWVEENCDGLVLAESKSLIYKHLYLPTLDPIIYGTVDIQVLGEGDTFWLLDFKYGVWNVPIEDNHQLQLYAIGLLDNIEGIYDNVILGILQPRGRGAKLAMYSVKDVKRLKPFYERAIRNALSLKAKANPSYSNCMFCNAQLICPDYFHNGDKDLDELIALDS